jgi:predicted RNA-binding Zn ribbon-like protein
MPVAQTIDELELTGGDPALDFVNTVETRASDPLELLRSYRDLVDWTAKVGLVDAKTARSLRRFDAQDVLARAIALREAAYELLVAVAVEHTPPPARPLAVVNTEIADAGRGLLVFDAGVFTFRAQSGDALLPLHLVARALADLLTSSRLHRVGRCEGVGNCGWLFLDTTKNHSRRWCSMAGCGSRAKMRRYYARGKAKR